MKKFIQTAVFSFLLLFTVSFFTSDAVAQGCVMCRAQVGENKDQDEKKLVGSSLNTGILYLMAAPYFLVGTIGFFWYRSRKKAA